MVPPLITLEEHFFSEVIMSSNDASYSEQLKHIPGLTEKLTDLDNLRLSSMDEGHVSIQVISHAPGEMTPAMCRSANDQLARAISRHPSRYAGFAVLPVSDPKASAAELTRCIKELHFVGALIDNHTHTGTYFDGEAYLPFWQTAASLDVPIYLHPTWPTNELRHNLYSGNFSPGAATSIASSGFGWHSDVATHVLKLFASGLFDLFPSLKIIIGHMGEMLPFMLDRIIQLSPRWGNRERDFKQVWDDNIWITTSGVWSLDPMACILRNTKVDHILYSVDYPFAKNEDGLKWIQELERSGLVDQDELEVIAYKAALKLLRLNMK